MGPLVELSSYEVLNAENLVEENMFSGCVVSNFIQCWLSQVLLYVHNLSDLV